LRESNIIQEYERRQQQRLKPPKRVLQWIVRDLGDAFPEVESTQNVCGSERCLLRQMEGRQGAGRAGLMEIEHLIRYAPRAVGLMEIEKYIWYAPLPWG
jgi:hypothetical protein